MEREAPTVRVGGVYRENWTPSQRAKRHFHAGLAPLF